MAILRESILSILSSLSEGGLITPNEFFTIASRNTVYKEFSRLVKDGKLLRLGCGIYSPPVIGKFGPRPPSTELVINSLSSIYGEIIMPNKTAEANALGLTTQVPIREVFLTSGRSRKLRLGNRVIELRHFD